MTSHRTSPYTHLPPLAWIVSALVLLSLLGWSGVPATSAPPAPALTLHSPNPGALHLTWPAVTPAPPAYHVRYAPADTPLLIKEATSSTHTLTLYELEPSVLYTVQVRAGTGPWSVPGLQRIDDYRADPETVGTIGVGAEEAGYIESAGDTDWFFIDLAAGEGYPIEVTGAPAPSLAVYDATGAVVQQGLAWHHAGALTFTPATAGLYHVAVGGPAAAPGRYTLTVDEPPTTALPPRRSRTLAGAEPTAPPAPRTSTAAPAKPRGLTATATHDQVVLTWDDPGDASITGYVILRRVRVNDTGGAFSELVPDTGSAAATYTDDTVVAETTYTYRIKAINAHGVSARSRWVHIDIPAAPEPEGQAAEPPAKPTGLIAAASHDSVALTWDDPQDESITGYVILRRVRVNDTGGDFSELVPDTGSAATGYTDDTVAASTTYTYRLKAINEHGVSERSRWFHIDTPAAPEAVEGDDQDGDGGGAPGGPGKKANVSEGTTDLPHDTTTTGEVDVGGSVTGNIRNVNDKDWFAVELEAGKRYQIDMEGADTGRGTLTHPRVGGIYDAASNAIANTANDGGGVGNNARVIYTPDAAGTYYVEAYLKTGVVNRTYTLSVIVLGATGASEADTDFPNTTATTGRVEVGASATGNIGDENDRDGFLVDLEAGGQYRFDLEGAATGRGTLPDPHLSLYGESFNVSHFISDDDDGGEGRNSRLTYTVTATGTYHLEVEGLRDPGTYTLSVRDLRTPVDVGGSVTGNIETDDERDSFLVDLEANTTYEIAVKGFFTDFVDGVFNDGIITDSTQATNYGYNSARYTLHAPAVTVRDSEGETVKVGRSSTVISSTAPCRPLYFEHWDPVVEFTPTEAGTYTLEVASLGGGNYWKRRAPDSDGECASTRVVYDATGTYEVSVREWPPHIEEVKLTSSPSYWKWTTRADGSAASDPVSAESLSTNHNTVSPDTYGRGETIRFRVTFTEEVEVTGTPRLYLRGSTLSRGGQPTGRGDRWASYESGGGTKQLVFAYTVGSGDRDQRGFRAGGGWRGKLTFRLPGVATITSAATGSHAVLDPYQRTFGSGDHKVNGSVTTP